jgi:hypothetical protein
MDRVTWFDLFLVCLFARHTGKQINPNPWQGLPFFKLE